MVGVPQPKRFPQESSYKLGVFGAFNLPCLFIVVPIRGAGLCIWAGIAMYPFELRVGDVEVSPLNVIIVQCAVNYF